MLSDIRIEHVLGMGNGSTSDYNCWGATMFLVGAKDNLAWVEQIEIGEWLVDNTQPVKRTDIRAGDILALFDRSDEKERMSLVHTAVCVGNGKFLHKLGQQRATLDTQRGVIKHYQRCSNGMAILRIKETE